MVLAAFADLVVMNVSKTWTASHPICNKLLTRIHGYTTSKKMNINNSYNQKTIKTVVYIFNNKKKTLTTEKLYLQKKNLS